VSWYVCVGTFEWTNCGVVIVGRRHLFFSNDWTSQFRFIDREQVQTDV
jgi:hypothetical protein